MSQQAIGEFKDPTNLTRWVKRFLYVDIAITIVALISGILEYHLLNDFKKGIYTSELQRMAAAESSDVRQGLVGIIQIVVFIVTGILVLKWIRHANWNARQLGAVGMKFTPGWSIGWYFIPFFAVYKPYQAMNEIWRASKNPANWQSESASSILGWWWFIWITAGVVNQTSLRLSLSAKELDELIAANVVTLFPDVISIPVNLLILAIVTSVYKMQMSKMQSRNSPLK